MIRFWSKAITAVAVAYWMIGATSAPLAADDAPANSAQQISDANAWANAVLGPCADYSQRLIDAKNGVDTATGDDEASGQRLQQANQNMDAAEKRLAAAKTQLPNAQAAYDQCMKAMTGIAEQCQAESAALNAANNELNASQAARDAAKTAEDNAYGNSTAAQNGLAAAGSQLASAANDLDNCVKRETAQQQPAPPTNQAKQDTPPPIDTPPSNTPPPQPPEPNSPMPGDVSQVFSPPPVGPPPPFVPPAVTPPPSGAGGSLTCNYTDGSGGTASFTTTDPQFLQQGCPPTIFPGLTIANAPPAPGGGPFAPLTPASQPPLTPPPPNPSGPVRVGPPQQPPPDPFAPTGASAGSSSGGGNGPASGPDGPLSPGSILPGLIGMIPPPSGGAPPMPPQVATNTTPQYPPTQPPPGGGSTSPQCPSGYVNWSCQNATGPTSGCLTPQDAASSTAKYTGMGGYTCSTSNQLSPPNPASANSSMCPPPNHQYACDHALVCAPSIGSRTGDSNCKPVPDTNAAPTPPPRLYAELNLKPLPADVQSCDSKPPFLPWGGTGSAIITVSGGKACGVGWHDTPGGPGGVTVLDSMTVASPPSHGTLAPKDQHVIIFTPAPGYKGQDSFTLTMQEHNGGRSATLQVNVSVTIQ
jgi:Bacterial Ig domain